MPRNQELKSYRRYRACVSFYLWVEKTNDEKADDEAAKMELDNRIKLLCEGEDDYAMQVNKRWMSDVTTGQFMARLVFDNE